MLTVRIHPSAWPILNENKVLIGWAVVTGGFEFRAMELADKTVETYIEWGDDQGGDSSIHKNWGLAKNQLDMLLQASQR